MINDLRDHLAQLDAAEPAAPAAPSGGSFSRGLRSGMTAVGGQLHALAGGVGEAAGAEDFARQQYAASKAAQELSAQQAPEVSDYHQVLDAPDVMTGLRRGGQYIAGLAGQAAPYLAAGAGAGLVTAATGGGALPAFLAGTAAVAPAEIGGALQRQQEDPAALANNTAGQRLLSAGLEGTGRAAAMSAAPAAFGLRGLGRLAPAGLGQGLLESIGGNAAGGAAAEGISTVAQNQLNPNRDTSGDNARTLDAAVGGAALGLPFGAAHVAGHYAGAPGRAIGRGLDAAGDKLSDLKDTIGDKIDAARGVTKDAAGDIVDATGKAVDAGQDFVDKAVAGFRSTPTGAYMMDAAKRATTSVGKMVNDLKEYTGDKVDAVVALHATGDLPATIAATASSLLDKSVNAVGTGIDRLAELMPNSVAALKGAADMLNIDDNKVRASETKNAIVDMLSKPDLDATLKAHLTKALDATGTKAVQAFVFTAKALDGKMPDILAGAAKAADYVTDKAKTVASATDKGVAAMDRLFDYKQPKEDLASKLAQGIDPAAEKASEEDPGLYASLKAHQDAFINSMHKELLEDGNVNPKRTVAVEDIPTDPAKRTPAHDFAIGAQYAAEKAEKAAVKAVDTLAPIAKSAYAKVRDFRASKGEKLSELDPGLRDKIAERIVPFLQKARPELLDNPDAMNKLADSLRHVLVASSTGEMHPDVIDHLRAVFGGSATEMMHDLHSTLDPSARERLKVVDKMGDDDDKSRTGIQFLRKTIPPERMREMAGAATDEAPFDLHSMDRGLLANADGSAYKGLGAVEARTAKRRFEQTVRRHLGSDVAETMFSEYDKKAKEESSKLKTSTMDDRGSHNAEEDQLAHEDDSRQSAEGDDAQLKDEFEQPRYYGGGKSPNPDAPMFVKSIAAHDRENPNGHKDDNGNVVNGEAYALRKKVRGQNPDRHVDEISAKDYMEEVNARVQEEAYQRQHEPDFDRAAFLKDNLLTDAKMRAMAKGPLNDMSLIRAHGMKVDARFEPADIARMTVDTNMTSHNDNPSTMDIGVRGSKIDAIKMMAIMKKASEGPVTGETGQARLRRLFVDGIGALSDHFGKPIDIRAMDDVVLDKAGTTWGDVKHAKLQSGLDTNDNDMKLRAAHASREEAVKAGDKETVFKIDNEIARLVKSVNDPHGELPDNLSKSGDNNPTARMADKYIRQANAAKDAAPELARSFNQIVNKLQASFDANNPRAGTAANLLKQASQLVTRLNDYAESPAQRKQVAEYRDIARADLKVRERELKAAQKEYDDAHEAVKTASNDDRGVARGRVESAEEGLRIAKDALVMPRATVAKYEELVAGVGRKVDFKRVAEQVNRLRTLATEAREIERPSATPHERELLKQLAEQMDRIKWNDILIDRARDSGFSLTKEREYADSGKSDFSGDHEVAQIARMNATEKEEDPFTGKEGTEDRTYLDPKERDMVHTTNMDGTNLNARMGQREPKGSPTDVYKRYVDKVKEFQKASATGAALADKVRDLEKVFNRGDQGAADPVEMRQRFVVADSVSDVTPIVNRLTAKYGEEIAKLKRGEPITGPKAEVKSVWSKAAKKGEPDAQYNLQRASGPTAMPAADRVPVLEHLRKVLGPKVKATFERLLHAGSYDPVEGIKISLHSLDPMGTAFHESLHALMQHLRENKLNDANDVLFKAASGEHVMKQLRELLKNEPDALHQIESSAEERAAYMYQFSRTMGADGKPLLKIGGGAKGVIGRIAEFIQRTLGLWTNDDRATHILDHFHDGRVGAIMDDRNALSRVLLEHSTQQTFDKIKTSLKPLARLANNIVGSGDSVLRDTGNEHFIEIANRIMSRTTDSGKETGFINAQGSAYRAEMNTVVSKLRDLKVTNAHLEDAITAMQTESTAKTAEGRLVVRALQGDRADGTTDPSAFFPRMKAYMEDAGIKVGDLGPKYFPVVWDPSKIASNTKAFVAMLQKYKDMGHDIGDPNDLMNRIISNGGNEFGIETNMPGMQHLKERKLDFISPEDREKFLQKNLFGAVASYAQQATRRAEWAKRFGAKGEGLIDLLLKAKRDGATDAQLKDAQRYIRGVDGTLGDDIDPGTRRLFGNMLVYQNLRLLPMAVFSMAVDPGGILVRGGSIKDAFGAFKRGITEIKSGFEKDPKRDEWYKLAQTMGVIEDHMLTHALGSSYSQGMVGDTGRKFNDLFFKYNLVEQMNTSMRVAATKAAIGFIGVHAKGDASPHSGRWLNELGLTPNDIVMGKDKRPLLSKQDFLDAGYDDHIATMQSDKMRNAVNKWVDGAVLRPNAAHKPVWMNDPHFALISHLKQFTYSFNETIIKRTINEAKHGNYTPAMALASYVPTMIAADALKGAILTGGGQPSFKDSWDVGDYISNGMERAGLFGVGQFGLDAVKDVQHGGVGLSLLGPTIEQLSEGVRALAGREAPSTFVMNSLPANLLLKSLAGNADKADPVASE